MSLPWGIEIFPNGIHCPVDVLRLHTHSRAILQLLVLRQHFVSNCGVGGLQTFKTSIIIPFEKTYDICTFTCHTVSWSSFWLVSFWLKEHPNSNPTILPSHGQRQHGEEPNWPCGSTNTWGQRHPEVHLPNNCKGPGKVLPRLDGFLEAMPHSVSWSSSQLPGRNLCCTKYFPQHWL